MRGRPTNRFSIRCMRVRVIASRISAMIDDRRSNAPSTGTSVGFAEAAGELVARQHHVGDGAHHPVEQLDRKADGARRRGGLALPVGRQPPSGVAGTFGARRERGDQHAVVAGRHFLAGLDRGDHLADPVDHREHRADERPVGLAAAGANVGQRILGGVAQRLEPREFEEAAIALDGVNEAEDANRGARGRRAAASQATISPPRASSMSRHSATKSAIRSSIGSDRPPKRWFEGLMPGRS